MLNPILNSQPIQCRMIAQSGATAVTARAITLPCSGLGGAVLRISANSGPLRLSNDMASKSPGGRFLEDERYLR